MTAEQCGVRVARVSDLAQFAGRTTMILEVKRGRWEDGLIAAVSEWPGIIVSSFDHRLIAELTRRDVKFPSGIVYYGALARGADYARGVGAHYVFPSYRYVDREVVDEMHAAEIKVVPWTANRPRDWQRLRDAGCDGVITDFPGDAVRWRSGNL
jgi:glycerophosphoryl diester phosphodiesterase